MYWWFWQILSNFQHFGGNGYTASNDDGKRTRFIQICLFLILNLCEIWIIMPQLPGFSKKYTITGNQRKYASEEIKYVHPFCCYSLRLKWQYHHRLFHSHCNAGMENFNQDHPQRYSNFCGLYIKLQGCLEWPWTWWGRWKSQGHWPCHPSHGKWRKAFINICKYIEVLKLCIIKNANN